MKLFLSVWLLAACCFLFGSAPVFAQDDDLVIFDDNFTDDPTFNDWILLYSGTPGGGVPPNRRQQATSSQIDKNNLMEKPPTFPGPAFLH